VLCSLGAAQSTTGGTPTRSVRFQAVQILVDDQLAADVGNVASADQKTVNSILSQMNTSRPSVPKSLQPTYDKVAEEFARAQAAVIALGRSELEKQGKSASSITDNAAYAEGQKVRTQFAKSAHITVDPRYGSVVDGQLQPGDGSLSVPVSSMAREGTPSVTQPNASLVSQLPASQKCSS
jgi:hypothetical protein